MDVNTLKTIFNAFNLKARYVSHLELNSGHINDTFLVKTDTDLKYVLQRINHLVFTDIKGLINNKVLISNHIKNKFLNLSEEELNRKILIFIKAQNTALFYHNENGNYWNLTVFIEDSITHDTVNDEEIAYEGGKLLGEFLNLTSDFDSSQLIDVIPNFHDMSFRYKQFVSSLYNTSKDRLQKAKKYIKIVNELREEMHSLQKLKDADKIPLRVTHNDAKISNLLFTKENKGICMIDLDTIMPGVIHYDFGDAIRTICNPAAEDEKDLSKVKFNLDYYKAFKKGFIEKMKHSLSQIELEQLPLAVKTMIFIMALRFLTDYLNKDVYYKIKYTEHNLDRAKNQFKLLESFSKKISNEKSY